MWSKFTAWVAALGQNQQFLGFVSHAATAALIVQNLPHPFIIGLVIIIIGGVKEFYFDAVYETTPKQTEMNNLEDFFGWVFGATLGCVLHS